jgi:hypothetical protein
MLLRRAAATLATTLAVLAATAALTGCDDGPPGATVGNPDATADSSTGGASAGATNEPDTSPYPTYVALGDSYTSAPGVPETELQSGCLRSNGNYPSLVAAQLRARHDTTFVDVSCSGATTLSLVGSQRAADRVIPPQFEALTPETSLVTVGIGGNDLELFTTMVGGCVTVAQQDPEGAPCRDYMEETGKEKDLLLEKIDKIAARVTSALKGVRDRSPQAEVVLVGYPQPVPAKGRCKMLPLAEGDYPYVRRIVTELGDALKGAARKAKASYVDLLGPSKGHDICAGEDAWVNGIAPDVNRALAFHPFAEEQQAVADLVLAKLRRS